MALNDCGCCSGLTAATPVDVVNRPGLSAISYRVGTHSSFLESMLASLSSSSRPALAALKTRASDDYAVALLDAFAVMADVLTFYQERIRNEAYLKTARERLSVLQLARLIGYELRPGVAAATLLAFELESGAGAPGYALIDVGTQVQSLPGPGEVPQVYETVEKLEARAEWNAMRPRQTRPSQLASVPFRFKGLATGLRAGDGILITVSTRIRGAKSTPGPFFRHVKKVENDNDAQQTMVTLDEPIAAAGKGTFQVYALRTRASLFGAAAPNWKAMPKDLRDAYDPAKTATDWPYTQSKDKTTLVLDTVYNQISPGSFAVVLGAAASPVVTKVKSRQEKAAADYTLSAKVTELTVETEVTIADFATLRGITVYTQSELLTLADEPDPTPIQGDEFELQAPLSQSLLRGRPAILTGRIEASGESAAEPIVFQELTSVVGGIRAKLVSRLANVYTRTTVTINANVAPATHGESKKEVLGGGDSTLPYQRFTLKNAPLTYVGAKTPTGSSTTLQVRVNDLLWKEVPFFFGHGSNERTYVTRMADDDSTTVIFGDGRTGARLPSGQENVKASYRKGSGLSGLVKAGQLSLLMTRPLGVKGVNNPMAPTGAADREELADARSNAPLTVLTFDRVVSLQDYEDMSRAFAGVSKALATWFWDGQVQGIFLTIAGPRGASITRDSKTYRDLLGALRNFGDPRVHLRLDTFRSGTFHLAVELTVDQTFLPELVIKAVTQALRDNFSFEARGFGQPVVLSEVIAVIQDVAGVVAAYVTSLHRMDTPLPDLSKILAAAPPDPGAAPGQGGAEMLILAPDPIPVIVRDLVPVPSQRGTQ